MLLHLLSSEHKKKGNARASKILTERRKESKDTKEEDHKKREQEYRLGKPKRHAKRSEKANKH